MGCSQNTQLKNVSLQMKHLEGAEINTRRPASVATIGINTAAARGAKVINVTSDVAVDLYPGSMLTFLDTTGGRRLAALVKAEISLAATTAADVTVAPLFDAIPATVADALYYVGLEPLRGVTTFGFQNADQTVDATSVDSGDGQESDVVRAGRNISIEGIAKAGDRGFYNVVQPIGLSPGLLGCEVYAELILPDGDTFVGAAKIMNFSQPGNQNEIKRYSFELQMQGDSYDHYAPYLFT